MANGMTLEAAPCRAQAVPWYIWASAVAVTATSVGLYWDISWHMSIGRDTFWTPEHLGIHFGAIVAGLSSVFLIFSTTFGAPASDLEPYMGMAGHLVILRRDLSVFAHVHPAGTVPMAALMLLENNSANDMASMPGTQHGPMPAEITFPYGFPQAGDYRLFLQVKRAGQVETAVFDTQVVP
jgi:hypothetical protein